MSAEHFPVLHVRVRRLPALLMAILLFITHHTLSAQVEKGVITGVVKDTSGALVSGAQIALKNISTGILTNTSSNGEGIYVSPPLTPGDYDVRITAPGFNTSVQHVHLAVAQRLSADTTLEIAAAAQSIEVQSTTVQFDTETATISNLRTEEAVHNLPLNGRNFAELLGLGAGVVPGQSQLAGTIPYAQQRGPTAYAINGQRLTDNRFLLAGVGDNENHNGLGVSIFVRIDAVEEYREE